MPSWLQYEISGNSLVRWCIALAITIVVFLALQLIRRVVAARLHTEEAGGAAAVRKALAAQVHRTNRLFLLVLALYAGSYALTLPDALGRAVSSITAIGVILQAAIWGSAVIAGWVTRLLTEESQDNASIASALGIIRFLTSLTVWSVALLLVLDNLGINVTALVAGLGVGGVAIGLATQRILGDLFSSLAIVLDKPFVVGDFLIFGEYLGNVERIGIKTTRLRSLSGEQIVCGNSDLLSTRIRNYGRMYERRVLFTVGVTYQTPHEALERIPQLLREAVEAQQGVRFDRAHFKSYGDFALIFETVYYVLNPDYNVYMDTQQAINLHIHTQFEAANIDFAYPTQTLYLLQETTPAPAEG